MRVQVPEQRLATIAAAGRAAVPFTSGLLVGIGEGRRARLRDLLLLLDLHRRHGHLQVSHAGSPGLYNFPGFAAYLIHRARRV